MPPIQVKIVCALAAAMAIALFWIDHIPRHGVVLQVVYFPLCAGYVYALYRGHRWAFLVNVLTLWIFPLETWKGIKAPVTGSVLALTQLVGTVLLIFAWGYYWRRRGEEKTA